jgi:hypothetical protein
MFLFNYMFACVCLYSLRLANRLRSIPELWGNRRPSFGDQEIKLFEFYKVEDSEHLFVEGKCPLTYLCPIHSLIHLPLYTFMPKDWLVLLSMSLFTYLDWIIIV